MQSLWGNNSLAAALAPRRVVEVMDRTFRIYRENFIAFVGLVALLIVPLSVVNFVLTQAMQDIMPQQTFEFDPNTPPQTLPADDQGTYLALSCAVAIVGLISVALQGIFINGTLTAMASESHLGRRIGIMEGIGIARNGYGILAGGLIFLGILIMVGLAVTGLSFICILPPFFLFPAVIYYAFLAGSFLAPVSILEHNTVWLNLTRSVALVRRRFWQVFGFMIGTAIVVWVIQLGLGIISVLILGASGGVNSFEDLQQGNALSAFLNMLVTVVVTPIVPIGLTVMYYDTRVRTEGLDIALQSVNSAEPRPRDVVSPEPQDPLFSGEDVKNIVLVFGLLVGLAIAFLALIFLLAAMAMSV